MATISQLYNPRTNSWDDEIFEQLTMPKSIMQEVVPTGTTIGKLSDQISVQTGLKNIPIIAVASHDSASALAAVPALEENSAYITSGSMSLIGIDSPAPIINEKMFKRDFAYYGGAFGTSLMLKSMIGLWILHECKNEWSKARVYSYDDLLRIAEDTVSLGTVIDPDRVEFSKHNSMLAAIKFFCRTTGQSAPQSIGQFVRVILESLAIAYRYALEEVEDIIGKEIKQIYIVGGGSQNSLLCQLTADATGLPVYAGPAEATAIGNILIQSKAFGKIASLKELRQIVRRSFKLKLYEPTPTSYWDEIYARFLKLKYNY
jgi:rhamnulokinase